MEREVNKFHALQLFTDTFAAETVHLTNEQVGIYIRLLCFAWTKNAKPFTTESARRICQCRTAECEYTVDDILREFFIFNKEEFNWTHKRLVQEHEYLTSKYKKKSDAGRKGMKIRYDSVNNKTVTPIPNPIPIPKKDIYDPVFDELWKSLHKKKGSKFKAHEIWLKLWSKGVLKETDTPHLVNAYNNQIQDIKDDTYLPHFTTWLNQRRWENEERQEIPDLIKRLENLGYVHYAREGNIERFTKDGNYYKIDVYDEKHQLVLDNEKESKIQAH
tara:strand:+ start:587 stop:1408 length:822 start_codon:yes stop_codon:yes gene_type:complete